MGKKTFRLESVLKLRQMELDQQQLILAGIQNRLSEEIQRRQDKQGQLDQQNAVLSQLYNSGPIPPDTLLVQQRFMEQLRRAQDSIELQIESIQKELELQQNKVLEANQEVKKMEKLKEKE